MIKLKRGLIQAILFTLTLFISLPSYADFGETINDVSHSIESFMHDAGQIAIGGGIILLAVIGLILGVMAIFSLFMMARR